MKVDEEILEGTGDIGACDKVGEMLWTVFRARAGYTRALIFILISSMLTYIMSGNSDIDYLYTRKMFDWTEAQYTRVTTATTIIAALCSLLLLPALSFKLGVSDHMIGVMASLTTVLSNHIDQPY